MTRDQKIVVILFDHNGNQIKKWDNCTLAGASMHSSGLVEAFTSNGKGVRIRGGIIVMEEQ